MGGCLLATGGGRARRLMGAAVRGADPEGALGLHARMRAAGVPPDVFTYTILMKVGPSRLSVADASCMLPRRRPGQAQLPLMVAGSQECRRFSHSPCGLRQPCRRAAMLEPRSACGGRPARLRSIRRTPFTCWLPGNPLPNSAVRCAPTLECNQLPDGNAHLNATLHCHRKTWVDSPVATQANTKLKQWDEVTALFRELDGGALAAVDRAALNVYVEALSQANRMRQATSMLARADDLAAAAGPPPLPLPHPFSVRGRILWACSVRSGAVLLLCGSIPGPSQAQASSNHLYVPVFIHSRVHLHGASSLGR